MTCITCIASAKLTRHSRPARESGETTIVPGDWMDRPLAMFRAQQNAFDDAVGEYLRFVHHLWLGGP